MLKEQIKQLLHNGQHPEFGRYKNLISQPLTTFWDDEGLPLMKKRRTQRKTWIFYGTYTEDLFAGLAIVDAGIVATAFAYFFIPSENLFLEDKITVPMGFKSGFDPSMTDQWKLKKFSISTTNNIMSLNYSGKFKLEMTAHLQDNGVSTIAPSSHDRPFNFTYKDLPITTEVKVEYNKKTYTAAGPIGAIDFTKGYPPKSTEWNWSSFIGKTESGKEIAVNIVDKFNHNLENILWIDKKRIILSDANFEYGPDLSKDLWHIKTSDKILDIEFEPYGSRAENINAVIMKSIFTQPFGKYTGTVLLDGVKEKFTAWGVAEEHLAVW